MVGAFVIILDPIFQGLAVSLLFGVGASTLLTLIVIPVLYFHLGGCRRTPFEPSTDPVFGEGKLARSTEKPTGALIT
jgi:predicted RND superfamily exporter protein